jgi:mannitol/fructose-specific phosphotransferase system IIA component (Ntr-type)
MAEFLSEDLIFLDLDAGDKTGIFRPIAEGMARHGAINSAPAFLNELLVREAVEPTCIGRGVAFPHTRTDLVKHPVIAFARPRVPISFNNSSADDARLIFVMGTPKAENNLYLNILSRLCKMLRQTDFRDSLISARTPREAMRLIQQKELQDLEKRHSPSLVH